MSGALLSPALRAASECDVGQKSRVPRFSDTDRVIMLGSLPSRPADGESTANFVINVPFIPEPLGA